MNVYFMRHGETDWNKVKRIQGTTDIPLNKDGIAQTKRTAAAVHQAGIHFDCVYTSPLQRARQTAELMNAFSNAPVVADKRITEFCFGEAEGHLFDEIKANPHFEPIANWFFKPEAYRGGLGAEPFDAFFSRIDSFLAMLREKELVQTKGSGVPAPENVLVVCHGGMVRGLLKQMCRLDVDRFASTKIPNLGLNLAELKNGEFTIRYTAKVF